jgi:cobalamin biosynthesis protein CbiG
MGLGQTVSGKLAIGVGCRAGCPDGAIVRLVRQALTGLESPCGAKDTQLYTIEGKRGEPGLRAAAEALRMDLVFLSREALQAAMSRVVTRSAAAERRFDVASVAEAAALAGAGPAAVLLIPRIAADGATCAIAALPEEDA